MGGILGEAELVGNVSLARYLVMSFLGRTCNGLFSELCQNVPLSKHLCHSSCISVPET